MNEDDQTPLADHEKASLSALGWAFDGGGINDEGIPVLAFRSTNGTRVRQTRSVWRTMIKGRDATLDRLQAVADAALEYQVAMQNEDWADTPEEISSATHRVLAAREALWAALGGLSL